MRLFHISEEADITHFAPRPSPSNNAPLERPAVWAISEETVWMYMLPRNCPRVAYRYNSEASDADITTFLHGDRSRRVLALEAGWFERCCITTLYCYEFSEQDFSLYDQHALYYVAYTDIKPIAISIIAHPLQALLQYGVDVHVLPELWNLRELIVQTSLSWSIIRMRNAAAPARGYTAYLPL